MSCNTLFWALIRPSSSIEYIPSDDKKTLEIKGVDDIVTNEGISNSVDSNTLENVIIHQGIIELGPNAFFGFKGLKQITMPLNVKYLRDSCFQNCTGLKSIELKEGLIQIGKWAFGYCESLESITLPSSLQSITNEHTFFSCSSLAHYYVTKGDIFSSSKDNTILIKNNTRAFSGPGAYKIVKIPDSIEIVCSCFLNYMLNASQIEFSTSGNLHRIEDGSFRFTSISHIEYPHGLLHLGKGVLDGNNVDYVKIPSTLTSYESGLFSPTPKEVEIEPGCPALKQADGIIFNSIMNEILFVSSSKTEYSIPVSITKIDPVAIRGAEKLSKLTNNSNHLQFSTYENLLYDSNQVTLLCCPGGVHDVIVSARCKKIAADAFQSISIFSIRFEGENLVSISNSAFHSVKNLTKLVLPNGLVTLGSYIVSKSDIEEVIFPATLQNILYETFLKSNLIRADFSQCSLLTTFLSGTFRLSQKLETVVLPPYIQYLKEDCFVDCLKLKEVIFPASTKSIGSSCFSGCLSLSIITFEGDNITDIGLQAFYKCNISSIRIPDSIRILQREIFAENKALNEVNISEYSNIEEIQMGIFRGCENIESLEFGRKLNKIPAGCLYEMKSLKWIEISKNNPTYESYEGVVYSKGFETLVVFPNGGTQYRIHNEVRRFGESAFFRCEQLQEVNTLNSSCLESFESKTFLGCILLRTIEIPSNVQKLSSLAFSGCINLEKVIFGKGSKVETIESDTFKECNRLREVIFDEIYYDENIGYFNSVKEFEIKHNVYQNHKIEATSNKNNKEIKSESRLFEIKSGAFEGFKNLERFDFPKSVKIIGDRAFAGCSKLKAISIFNVEHIGRGSFMRCSTLKYLHFGYNITLEEETFYGCDGLIQITYCGIVEISSNSFSNNLIRVSVPIKYPEEEFGGLKVQKILDDSCNFPSGRFTILKDSSMNKILLNILNEETEERESINLDEIITLNRLKLTN